MEKAKSRGADMSYQLKNNNTIGEELKGNSNMTSPIYTKEFFKMIQKQNWKGALRIVPKVLELIQPTSVIDIGCGTGEFLAAFCEHGIKDILGIDGEYVRNLLVIPQEYFMPFDLCQPFTLERTYDMAICLEVAEHLPPKSASGFIASLTRLAPVILFSAAIPYQGGNRHLNEQWPEYWATLFRQQGFVPIDALRRSIWHESDIPFWYRQNMLFFCNEKGLAGNEKLAQAYTMADSGALSLVHPEMYLQCNMKSLRMLRHLIISFGRIRHMKNT
jgi:SAM-dependent methyltransferase